MEIFFDLYQRLKGIKRLIRGNFSINMKSARYRDIFFFVAETI